MNHFLNNYLAQNNKVIFLIFNHECWMKCQNCGLDYDARLSSLCDSCKHDNREV